LIRTADDTLRRISAMSAAVAGNDIAIRAGLPNGTSPLYILTSDFAGVLEATVVRWAGIQTAYTDQYSANMTWAAPTTAR